MGNNNERDELLAFVAEKYYQEDKKQTEIAEMIGLTRSAVSRMLTEAREKSIVEIIIHRPFQYDRELESKLQKTLNLKHVSVVVFSNQPDYDEIRKQLGKAASRLLANLIKPGHKQLFKRPLRPLKLFQSRTLRLFSWWAYWDQPVIHIAPRFWSSKWLKKSAGRGLIYSRHLLLRMKKRPPLC
ncbi:MAG: hypothetical protein K8R16_03395 [Anaerolineales bacterium]|nr:hypothetical protein [Anaerolineales bacterium]